ncbi:hypothetical protein K438DRAFT_1777337 [Mycena galopus ATCC 62051]|nr:hypothetical protein K438DRAFT_1777337 [Mycena galopus ATCC 62051]
MNFHTECSWLKSSLNVTLHWPFQRATETFKWHDLRQCSPVLEKMNSKMGDAVWGWGKVGEELCVAVSLGVDGLVEHVQLLQGRYDPKDSEKMGGGQSSQVHRQTSSRKQGPDVWERDSVALVVEGTYRTIAVEGPYSRQRQPIEEASSLGRRNADLPDGKMAEVNEGYVLRRRRRAEPVRAAFPTINHELARLQKRRFKQYLERLRHMIDWATR